jgi:threonine dehydrogenase-like Zn-dependent dehydrogenase
MLPTLDLKPLIKVYQLQEAIAAFEAHKKGQGIKIMLKP